MVKVISCLVRGPERKLIRGKLVAFTQESSQNLTFEPFSLVHLIKGEIVFQLTRRLFQMWEFLEFVVGIVKG